MTIAAFRVAQNETNLSNHAMSGGLLRFLLADSDTAIRHWINKGRLNVNGAGYVLTQEGLDECYRSLVGETRGFNTSEVKVREWINRMLDGDDVATRTQRFTTS